MRVRPQSEQVSPAAALTSPPATAARSDSELQIQRAQPKEKKKRTEKKLVKTKSRIVVPKSSLVDTTGDRGSEDDEEEEEVQEREEEGDAGGEEENGEAKRETEEPPVPLDAGESANKNPSESTQPKHAKLASGTREPSSENTHPTIAPLSIRARAYAISPEKAAEIAV